VDAAVELAEKFSAELILVHVITLASQRTTNMQRRQANAHEAMTRLIREVAPSQIKCRFQVIGDMLLGLAEEEAADLIVLASHGQSGWGRIFFGSMAESVVRLSVCAVLTVKRPTQI